MTKISNQYSLTNVLTADPVNGRVGIGTASPLYPLEVAKDITYSDNIVNGDAQFSVAGATTRTKRMTFGYDTNSTNGFGYIKTGNQGVAYTPLYLNPAAAGAGGVCIGYAPSVATPPSSGLLVQGNVGIGTTSPAYRLHVAGTALLKGVGNAGRLECEDDGITNITINPAFSSTGTPAIQVQTNHPLLFCTNNTERMRINADGNVGIGGIAASNFRFYVKGVDATSSNFGIVVADSNNVTNLYVMNNGTGYLRAAAWAYGSDRNIKENIDYIKTGLDKVLSLKPAKFDYIDGVKNNIGWIAQDVQEVIPEAVSTVSDTNEQLTLKSDFIVPYLVKAIQEQTQIIEDLKTRIVTLESK